MSRDDKLMEIILENHLALSNKIDNLSERMESRFDTIEDVQVAQAKDIETHIKRTNELQSIVTPLHEKDLKRQGVVKTLTIIFGTLITGIAIPLVLHFILKVF